jgi:uncharacterized membrane protein YkvA (DUF1232 family)
MTDQPMFHQPRRTQNGGADSQPTIWRRMRRLLRRLPLIDRGFAAYFCARDPGTPIFARVALFGAIAYFFMPFDAIPDFIPGVGHLDDAAILLLAIRLVAHRITPEHHDRARRRLDLWADATLS